MKTVNCKILIATLVLFFCSIIAVNAQTQTEQRMKELKARRAMAKETIGQGGKDNLNTMEREASVGEEPCYAETKADELSGNYFTAQNSKKGVSGDDKLKIALMQNCKQLLYQKIGGTYRSITRDYFDQMEVDDKSTAASHIESAGEMIVQKTLDDVQELCNKTSNPDERGNIIMYLAIRISKKNLVDNAVKELSQDKQLGVRFNEEKFRESAMKVFENDKPE